MHTPRKEPAPDAREAWSARDERWLHALVGLIFVLLAFAFGRVAEHGDAISAAHRLMAERQPHLQKDALEKAKGEVMEWFEKTWACKGFGLDGECVIRERRP